MKRRLLYTILSISLLTVMAGAATTVMPLLSAALYLGQFLSPLIVSPMENATGASAYGVGACIAGIYLLQAFLTRKKQVVTRPMDPDGIIS